MYLLLEDSGSTHLALNLITRSFTGIFNTLAKAFLCKHLNSQMSSRVHGSCTAKSLLCDVMLSEAKPGGYPGEKSTEESR